ncbi:MAG: SDR family NAD(P)-dependent oxidoreductase [Nitrospiraceae bacterium]|nr:MAG: SDR family NAD(P)-dependent oxidoreductase [Nitrospiraceae bacterium]
MHLNPDVTMVCLITGSSRGLGKAIALALGRKGHSVALLYRERKKDAESVASQIKQAITLQADVENPDDVRRGVTKVIDTFGRIDLLVNNAGITKEALLLKTAEKDIDSVLRTNHKGPFLLIRTVAPHMIKERTGKIINISSIAGIKGRAGLSAYAASKAGLIGLTRTAAAELGRYNIMVNAVLPGYLLTDMGQSANKSAQPLAMKDSVMDSFSSPENAAQFICCLSEMNDVTGQVFNLDSRII